MSLIFGLSLLFFLVIATSARSSLTWHESSELSEKLQSSGQSTTNEQVLETSWRPKERATGGSRIEAASEERKKRRILDDDTSAADVAAGDLQRPIDVIVPVGGGYCLDGSRPAYFFRQGQGEGVNSWVIRLTGGGWCFSWEECMARKSTLLGSSTLLPPEGQPFPVDDPSVLFGNETIRVTMNPTDVPLNMYNGMLSTNCDTNPTFCDWNVAELLYCDGGAHLGQAGTVFGEGGDANPLVFSGRDGLQQVLADLLTNQGLGAAENALVTGCSAGAHSVSVLCDWITGLLAPSTKAKCLMDAGMFLDFQDKKGEPYFLTNLERLHDLQQAGNSASAECLSENGAEPWRCLLPEISLKYQNTPTFIINHLYDFRALEIVYYNTDHPNLPNSEQVMACAQMGEGCSVEERDALEKHKEMMRTKVEDIVESKGDKVGYFIMEGAEHCSTASPLWTAQMPDGKVMGQEVASWFSKEHNG